MLDKYYVEKSIFFFVYEVFAKKISGLFKEDSRAKERWYQVVSVTMLIKIRKMKKMQ